MQAGSGGKSQSGGQNSPRTVVVDYDDFRRIRLEAHQASEKLKDLEHDLSELERRRDTVADVEIHDVEVDVREARKEWNAKEQTLKDLYCLGLGARRNWPSYVWKPALRWMIVSIMPDKVFHAFETKELGLRRPMSEEEIRAKWFYKATGDWKFWPANVTRKERDLELSRLTRVHDKIARDIDRSVDAYDAETDQDADEYVMRRYHAGDEQARFIVNRWNRGGGPEKSFDKL